MNHTELNEQVLANLETRVAYEEMEAEFSLLRQMLEARQKAGLSQAQVADHMGNPGAYDHALGIVPDERQAFAFIGDPAPVRTGCWLRTSGEAGQV